MEIVFCQDQQGRLGHKLHTSQTYLDRSGKVNARRTEESMTTFPDKERLLAEKINEWRTTNENEKEDAEELPVDHPEVYKIALKSYILFCRKQMNLKINFPLNDNFIKKYWISYVFYAKAARLYTLNDISD